jgi:hypothetical protein
MYTVSVLFLKSVVDVAFEIMFNLVILFRFGVYNDSIEFNFAL